MATSQHRKTAICGISWCDLWGHTEFCDKFRLAELYGFDPLRCFADSSIFSCQYLVRYAPRQLREAFPSQFVKFLKIQESEMVEDKTWWSAICLSLPYAVLVIVFAHDLFCHRLVRRLTLSQIIYERHFGIHGNHYVA